MSEKKIKIGITGGIGCGKTFVSKVFNMLGIPVFNADVKAKSCMLDNEYLKNSIKIFFGDNIYKNDSLDTSALAEIVFNDLKALEKLNTLVHPVVKKSFEDWCERQKSNIVIKEAAIMFESHSNIGLDKVICVSAAEDIRIKRVMDRDNISQQQVASRIDKQMPQYEKEELSDFIIFNNGDQLLLPQILKIINQIS